jgi:transposase
LRAVLAEAAHGAARTKGSYLSSLYHRLVSRPGKKKAIVAEGHCLLVTTYQLLQEGTHSQDLGANYHDERDHQTAARRAAKRLQRPSYQVTLEPRAAAP